MHNADFKSKLIQILSESPFVSIACRKAGINRSTYYRWYRDNTDFRLSVGKAIEQGRSGMCERLEAVVFKNALSGNLNAAKFILENNDPRYIGKRTQFVQPLSAEERKKFEELLRWKEEFGINEAKEPFETNKRDFLLEKILKRATPEELEELYDREKEIAEAKERIKQSRQKKGFPSFT